MWDATRNKIALTAHRGIKARMAENTLSSFRAALDLGVDVLEYDVHLTRDDVLVVIHDTTVERTTDGVGAVSFMTYDEVSRLDAGIRFGERFRGEHIPTMRETLDTLVSYDTDDYKPCQIVEIKDFRPQTVDAVVQMLREYGLSERTVIEAGDSPTLMYLQEFYPEFRSLGFPPQFMKRLDMRIYDRMWGVSVPFTSSKFTDMSQVLECSDFADEHGLALFMFSGDTPEQIDTCINCRAVNITSNDLPVAVEYLRKIGYRD